MMDLPLEELFNTVVTVASVKEETIPETPAVVSSFHTKNMATLGLRTLKDILSFMPGVVIDDSTFGNTQVLIRGITDAYGQKVLFLLDDVPLWMPVNSSIPLLGFPIELIDHVEVIRGPGAVIYGTNASSGVIKIVTKKDSDNKVALSLGSNNKYDAQTYWQETINNKHRLTLSLKKQEDDGYKGFYEKKSGVTKNNDREEEAESVYIRYNYNDFEVFTHLFESQFNGTLQLPGPLTRTLDATYQSALIHVSNNWSSEKRKTTAYSDYNIFYYEYPTQDDQFGAGIDAKSVFEPEHDNYRWRTGVTSNHLWTDDTSLFIGAETEIRSVSDLLEINKSTGTESILVASDNVSEHAIFGQIDHHIGSWRFLAGARLTRNSDYGSKLTPRLSTVYNIDDNQSLKLLYSVGFNAPNFFQTGLNAPVSVGNADLDPELIKMMDLAYTHASSDHLFVANVYHMSAEDFISRSRISDSNSLVNTFLNAGSYNRYGAELDFQYRKNQWTSYYNLSYHHQANRHKTITIPTVADDIDDQLANGTPRWTASMGKSYKFNNRNQLGASIRYIDDRDEIGSLTLVNINYSYAYKNSELYMTLRNVLDRTSENPDLSSFVFKRLPRSDKLNYLIGIKMSF